MKIIEIIVSPKGETTIQTKGYAGGTCREASKFIEQALGQHRRAAHRRVLSDGRRTAVPATADLAVVVSRVSPAAPRRRA